MPEQWSKPLTDAVVLPGHAQTTSRFGDQFAGDTATGDDVANSDLYGNRDATDRGDYGTDDVAYEDTDNVPNDGGEDNPYD